MTKFDEDVLDLVMSRMRAQELMEDPNYVANLSMGGLEDLLIRAGYSRKASHDEAKEHAMRRLASGRSI